MSAEREQATYTVANLVDILVRAQGDEGVLLMTNDDLANPMFAYGVGGYNAAQCTVTVLLASMALLNNLGEMEALVATKAALDSYLDALGASE